MISWRSFSPGCGSFLYQISGCVREIIAAARMSADELVISELRSWSETASAIAAGLGDVRSGWLAVPKPVGRP